MLLEIENQLHSRIHSTIGQSAVVLRLAEELDKSGRVAEQAMIIVSYVSGTSTKAFTATADFGESTNSGSACTVTRPPVNFGSAAPHIDANILGITGAEAVRGVDNITTLQVGNTTLGGLTTIGGNTYRGSAPSVTIAAPTARTVATAKVSTTDDTIEITGHNIRTGTSLTYTSNGTNITHSGGTLADATEVFAIRVDDDKTRMETIFKYNVSNFWPHKRRWNMVTWRIFWK